jgi:transcriptional regulator with XRE-family HTH domain
MAKRFHTPYDTVIAERIRQARVAREVSQERAAALLGISCHQWQKYETGKNRVSAGQLWMIAKRLNVKVSWFFEEPT